VKVTFIRHGASEWTGKPVLYGQTDVPLSELGFDQAQALAGHLSGRKFDALWSSHLQRARDTAALIGQSIGHAVVTDKRLSEAYLGTLEGESFAKLPSGPGTWRERWQKSPGTTRFPKGENLKEVADRGWTVLEELYERHPRGHVVIVSHMFAISTMLCKVLSLKINKFRTFTIDTASITTIQIDDNGFRILALNDTAHLDDLPDATALRTGSLPEKQF